MTSEEDLRDLYEYAKHVASTQKNARAGEVAALIKEHVALRVAHDGARDEVAMLERDLRELRSAVTTLIHNLDAADLPGRGPALLLVRSLIAGDDHE